MVTGGFKTRGEAVDAVATGRPTLVGSRGRMVLDPDVAAKWLRRDGADPQFPRFESLPAGGITAWFTMRLTALANGDEDNFKPSLSEAIERMRLAMPTASQMERAFGSRSHSNHQVKKWSPAGKTPAQGHEAHSSGRVRARWRPGPTQTTAAYAKRALRHPARPYQSLDAEITQLNTETRLLCAGGFSGG